MKKKISLILVVVMVLSCLAACGQAKTPAAESTVAPAETVAEGTAAPETETEPVVSGDVELASHFAPGSEQAAVLQGIADAFMAEHPEINVTIQFNGNENFVKMKTRFAANDAPDIAPLICFGTFRVISSLRLPMCTTGRTTTALALWLTTSRTKQL